ncbi:hypothetical protein LTR84_003905 [Exophiala bonariae]|uniref:Uncharacterized protein n=1 Tax=Exophiala bonariae TaxID=1690606 RepID=A0AAV9NAI4_9EURO|nr:hypothetical protein LTR84_003905 [Exophiala bonariae]
MPSQPLSTFSPPFPSPSCLPLNKFSYATVSSEHIAPIPWIHLSSKSGLFAIFEASPTQLENGQLENRQKLKVLRDPEVMEDIDLHLLSLEAHRSMDITSKSPNEAQVTIMVKLPNIAIKYPMTNGQIRRFQMRFASNEYFYDAMKLLSRANVPAVEAGSLPQNKPRQPVQIQAPTNILPEDSASQIGGFHPLPQSYGMSADLGSDVNRATHSMLISGGSAIATARNMPPPILRPSIHPLGQPPTMKDSTNFTVGNHSTLSMTTGTTLVPGIHTFQALPPDATAQHRIIATRPEVKIIVPSPSQPNEHDTHRHERDDLKGPTSGLLLPPRRELPFIKAKSATNTKSSHIPTLATSRADEPCTTSTIENDQSSHTARGRPKRAAIKTPAKPPAAKKPRATTTRKKPAPKKASKKETPVPSVEDLLNRSEPSRWTRSRSLLATQKQLPEQRTQQQGDVQVEDITRGDQVSQILPPRDRDEQRAQPEIEETPVDTRDTYPCTPADQIIQTHTPRLPTAPSGSSSPEKQIHLQEEQGQNTPFGLLATISYGSSRQKSPSVPHGATNVENQLVPGSDSTSTNANLAAWAALPPEIRNPVLRDFVCESIMQPGFIDLCKELENMWETTLLEPRLRK